MSTGGPAFPQPNHVITTDRGCEEARGWMADSGMTLLDWYAGQALASRGMYGAHVRQREFAKECYDIASAMLAEKARREGVVQQPSTTDDAGKVAKLEEVNRELVEALEALLDCISETRGNNAYAAVEKARAVFAKAEELA